PGSRRTSGRGSDERPRSGVAGRAAHPAAALHPRHREPAPWRELADVGARRAPHPGHHRRRRRHRWVAPRLRVRRRGVPRRLRDRAARGRVRGRRCRVHDPPGARPREGRAVLMASWLRKVGLGMVLTAAAVLSFAALRDLAIAVRIDERLAFLLPIAVDAGAAVSCTVWLSPSVRPDARRFACWLTWSLLTATVIGNAAQLGMHANGITPPWRVA